MGRVEPDSGGSLSARRWEMDAKRVGEPGRSGWG